MIWFNLKKLERKIIEDELSDKETFTYFLLTSVGGIFGISSANYQDLHLVIELLLTVVITIWGSYIIFNANQKGDGKDFFKRVFPLAWVVAFRLLIFTIIALIPITFVFYIFIFPDTLNYIESNITSSNEEWLYLILSLIVFVIFYLQLKNSFKRVASKTIL